jgi:hypothetical protein
MRWCCDFFKQMYLSKGRRGFAIVLQGDNEPYFAIQFRAVSEDKEANVNSNTPASLEGKTAIMFCPSCGKAVLKSYKKQLIELRNMSFENIRDGLQ